MLVLYVAIALLGSFLAEILLHHLRSNYEIEWVYPFRRDETDMAQEIAKALRKSWRESERQMNTPFKVSSGEGW